MTIRKAIIPIAGLGTRMGPLARAVPKAMFPLVDREGRVRPVVQYILDEARAAGVERAALVVSPAHLELLRKYFAAAKKDLDADPAQWVEFISQPSPQGFGEAVARGAHFVGEEPFLLLLGDHVYRAAGGRPACAAQVAAAFASAGGAAMIGVQAVGEEGLPRVGVVAGEPAGERVYRCRKFVEKPDIEAARRELRTPGLDEGKYLAHCGIYAFAPDIFECLSRLAVQDRPMGQELQLADAQAMLLAKRPDEYRLCLIDGRAYDVGTPAGYLAAQDALRE